MSQGRRFLEGSVFSFCNVFCLFACLLACLFVCYLLHVFVVFLCFVLKSLKSILLHV